MVEQETKGGSFKTGCLKTHNQMRKKTERNEESTWELWDGIRRAKLSYKGKGDKNAKGSKGRANLGHQTCPVRNGRDYFRQVKTNEQEESIKRNKIHQYG